MIEPALLSILVKQLATVVALSLIGAAVAARLGAFRWVGGLIAGLLLSGAVLGGLAPDLHQRLISGGHAAQQTLERTRAQTQAANERYMRDLIDSGVSRSHVESQRQLKRAERRAVIEPLEAAVAAAEARHAAVMDGWTWAVVLLTGFTCGAGARLRRWLASFADAAPMAVAAAALVAGGVLLVHTLIGDRVAAAAPGMGDRGYRPALLLFIIAIAGAVPLARSWTARLRNADPRALTDDAAGVAQATALLLALLAMIGLAGVPFASAADQATTADPGLAAALRLDAAGVALGLAIAAVVAGRYVTSATLRAALAVGIIAIGWLTVAVHPLVLATLAGLAVSHAPSDRDNMRGENHGDVTADVTTDLGPDDEPGGWRAGLRWFVGPLAACAVAMRISVDALGPIELLVGIVLLAILIGDARALGVWLGGRLLGGRTTGEAMRLGIVTCLGGPLPLVVAWTALRPAGEGLLAAIVLAHLAVGLFAPLALRWGRAIWPGERDAAAPPMQ